MCPLTGDRSLADNYPSFSLHTKMALAVCNETQQLNFSFFYLMDCNEIKIQHNLFNLALMPMSQRIGTVDPANQSADR